MHRRAFIFFSLLFCLVLSSNLSILASSPYSVGVKEGEKYSFIMEKYNMLIEDRYGVNLNRTDYELFGDEGIISLEDGDEFTYKIVNSTLNDRDPIAFERPDGTIDILNYTYPWALDVEITGPNGTTISSEVGFGFGNIISDIDWATHRQELDREPDYRAEQLITIPDIAYTYEVIDTNTEFGYKYQFVILGNDSDPNAYSYTKEVRYEIKTGVANMLKIEETANDISGNENYNFEFIYNLYRKGYTLDGEDTELLPGFTLYISISALITSIYRRKN